MTPNYHESITRSYDGIMNEDHEMQLKAPKATIWTFELKLHL